MVNFGKVEGGGASEISPEASWHRALEDKLKDQKKVLGSPDSPLTENQKSAIQNTLKAVAEIKDDTIFEMKKGTTLIEQAMEAAKPIQRAAFFAAQVGTSLILAQQDRRPDLYSLLACFMEPENRKNLKEIKKNTTKWAYVKSKAFEQIKGMNLFQFASSLPDRNEAEIKLKNEIFYCLSDEKTVEGQWSKAFDLLVDFTPQE